MERQLKNETAKQNKPTKPQRSKRRAQSPQTKSRGDTLICAEVGKRFPPLSSHVLLKLLAPQ